MRWCPFGVQFMSRLHFLLVKRAQTLGNVKLETHGYLHIDVLLGYSFLERTLNDCLRGESNCQGLGRYTLQGIGEIKRSL
jgi:hypothetical protein